MQTAVPDIEPLLQSLTSGVSDLLADIQAPLVIGIRTGGLWLAGYLVQTLDLGVPVNEIDVGFHRDDIATRGIGDRAIAPTRIDGTVDGRDVLLVDDVLHSGRTVRAALNAIFEYGRPQRVWLAVLVARSGRQLPICADVAGARLDIPADQRLRLGGPDPLTLTLTPIRS